MCRHCRFAAIGRCLAQFHLHLFGRDMQKNQLPLQLLHQYLLSRVASSMAK